MQPRNVRLELKIKIYTIPILAILVFIQFHIFGQECAENLKKLCVLNESAQDSLFYLKRNINPVLSYFKHKNDYLRKNQLQNQCMLIN